MNVLSIFEDARKKRIEKLERFKARRATYLLKNRDAIKSWAREFHLTHRDAINAKSRAYYSKNKHAINARSHEKRHANIDAYNALAREKYRGIKSRIKAPIPRKPRSDVKSHIKEPVSRKSHTDKCPIKCQPKCCGDTYIRTYHLGTWTRCADGYTHST